MRSMLPLAAVALLAACESAPTVSLPAEPQFGLGRSERTFRFTTIEVPGASTTTAFGINASGAIVGQYGDATGTHGFLYRNGQYTTIDYPGAVLTQARGIGNGGEIVGSYRMPGEPSVNAHGFLLTRDGTFQPIDWTGHTNTIAQRILPDGTVLGCYHDADFTSSMKGVLWSRFGNGETTAFASMHNGATPDLRRIVGLFTDPASDQGMGYVIEGGAFLPFVVPGSTFTSAWDVNPLGEIVGSFANADGSYGYLRTIDDEYVTIDFPGATATVAFGINVGGDVVGRYAAAGKTYGFLASATRMHNR